MKILVKAVAGSHLFGLNTPTSDEDYKGVYLPCAEDILLGRVQKNIKETTNPSSDKNSGEDIDSDFYSFDKFMKMLQEGQTVALELLFTPEDKIIEKDPMWDEIINQRDVLLHKSVTAFIGYCRVQANKYGIKGSRMNAMKKAIDLFNIYEYDKNEKYTLGFYWDGIKESLEYTEHINFIELPANKNMQNKMIPHIEICGRKFDKTNRIVHVRDILQKIYDNQGERTKLAAKNEGIDWKALSHALRVCFQGCELLMGSKITLPLRPDYVNIIKKVKLGLVDYKIVQRLIEAKMEELELYREVSDLPEELDGDFVDNIIINTYIDIVKGDL